MPHNEHPTFDSDLFTPPRLSQAEWERLATASLPRPLPLPPEPLYASQHVTGAQAPVLPFGGETIQQPPHVLEPALRLAENGDHKHLWALTPEGLRCYHCAWSLHAVLARAKALKEVRVCASL